jgi:hypothetical protein
MPAFATAIGLGAGRVTHRRPGHCQLDCSGCDGRGAEPNLLQGMPPITRRVTAEIDARPGAATTDIVEGRAALRLYPSRPSRAGQKGRAQGMSGTQPPRGRAIAWRGPRSAGASAADRRRGAKAGRRRNMAPLPISSGSIRACGRAGPVHPEYVPVSPTMAQRADGGGGA